MCVSRYSVVALIPVKGGSDCGGKGQLAVVGSCLYRHLNTVSNTHKYTRTQLEPGLTQTQTQTQTRTQTQRQGQHKYIFIVGTSNLAKRNPNYIITLCSAPSGV